MLDWIDVAIFDMAAEILFIADEMFPEAPLPDGSLAARNTNTAPQLCFGNCLREIDLDEPPTEREIGVVGWKRPYCMDVIGQHHNGVDHEGVAALRQPRRVSQGVDVIREQPASPVQQVDSKEPTPAGNKGATIIRHVRNDSNTAAQCATLIAPYG